MDTSNSRSRSIAWQLAIWYSLLSAVLIIAFGIAMYTVLKDRMRSDDDQVLAGKVAELRAILSQHGSDYSRLREEVERESSTSPGTYLRVLDGRGAIIAESGGPIAKHIPGTPGRLRPGTADSGFDWTAEDGNTYRIMSSNLALASNFTVYAAMDLSDDKKLLADFWRSLSIVGLLVVAIAVAMGYGIARKGLLPVSKLAAIVDQLDVHRLDRRVNEELWPEELQSLAGKFDSLLSRLETSFARLSQFSADIAHELRTPLHILRGEAELTLTHRGSADAYRACIESAMEEYERLSRMVDGLLFLARSEQPNAHLAIQSLDLANELTAVCNYYQAMADEQGVALIVEAAGHVRADTDLLRRALANLVGNALSNTPSGGQVILSTSSKEDGTVEIDVRDTGCGIAPENFPRIFDRFYRVDAARQRNGQHVGLGLPIVRSIMQVHRGAVSLQSKPGRGTTVTLSFPA